MNSPVLNSLPSYQSTNSPPSYEEANAGPLSPVKGKPTLTPSTNFNASWDAVAVNKALAKGNKTELTNILCRRSFDQRMQIASAYKSSFGKALVDEIKSKISGGVKNVYIGLLMSVPEFYCSHLKKGKNDKIFENLTIAVLTSSISELEDQTFDTEILIEMMCVTTNTEIRRFLATYQQMFNKRLEQEFRDDQYGKFKKLLRILAEINRSESANTSSDEAAKDAAALNKYFSKSSVNKKAIIELLATRSFKQIRLISEEYEKLTKTSLEKSIKNNISDTLKDGLVAIVRISTNPSEFFARRINKSLNDNVFDDRSISRLIIARCEIDLRDIKEEFNRIFRKSLKACITENTKGSLRTALLILCGEA